MDSPAAGQRAVRPALKGREPDPSRLAAGENGQGAQLQIPLVPAEYPPEGLGAGLYSRAQAAGMPTSGRLYRVYDGQDRKWRFFTGREEEDFDCPDLAPAEAGLGQGDPERQERINLVTPARQAAPAAVVTPVAALFQTGGDADGTSTEEYQRVTAVPPERRPEPVIAGLGEIKGFSRWPQVAEEPLMKPKNLRPGGEVVQDSVKTLITLLEKAMTTAVLLATNRDFSLIISKTAASLAKPVTGLQTKASLEATAKDLKDKMRGSTLFDAYAKQALSTRVEMPVTLLQGVHLYLLNVATFACSFSLDAAQAWKANVIQVTREQDELDKIVNHRREVMSVARAAKLLEDLQDSLEGKVREALAETYMKQKIALKAYRAADRDPPAKVQKTADPYSAQPAFAKVPSAPQEKAAMVERKRSLLDALALIDQGGNPNGRRNMLSRKLCRQYLTGNCNRGDGCRFVHLDKEDMDGVDLTLEEALASIPARRG